MSNFKEKSNFTITKSRSSIYIAACNVKLCREIFHFPETEFCRLCNALCGTYCVAHTLWHTLCGTHCVWHTCVALRCTVWHCVAHTVCSPHAVSVAQCTTYFATRCTAFCNETNQAEILPTSPFWRSALAAERLPIVEYLSIQMQSGFSYLWGGFYGLSCHQGLLPPATD